MARKKQVKENDWLVIDQETGELKDVVSEGDGIVHRGIDDGFIHNFNKGEPFVKIFDNTVIFMREKLTYSEMAFAISLIPYISYNDNILRLNGNTWILMMCVVS